MATMVSQSGKKIPELHVRLINVDLYIDKGRTPVLASRNLLAALSNCNHITWAVSRRLYNDGNRDQRNFGRYQRNNNSNRYRNSRFNSRPRTRSREDDDEVHFDKTTFSKLIHVPKKIIVKK